MGDLTSYWDEIDKMLVIRLGEIDKFWDEQNCLRTQIPKTPFVLSWKIIYLDLHWVLSMTK